ncbi:MAG: hypothetical protein AMS19_02550 [Gemmatimonas sp. SG8_23]|nr:MAG: hypothetical protein AMS19_02550 [Gemmatimonas sp. SG8_23]
MAIGDDFSVAVNGDIRHVSGTSTYTVLELHRWLQDLADDAAAGGNDLVDITSDTPSERSTDNIITLNSPYNIDDDAAEYFYDGSISQAGGDTLYAGLVVVGSLAGTTTLQVVQDNALYDTDSPFWGTGINVDAAANILSRFLIKVRDSGADIDGKRIRVFAREWGHTFAEFSVTMGLGNAVAAIFTVDDLNNATAVGTVATWTTITNVEGYQTIDLNNGNGLRPYFSQWNRDTYTINQLYERAKYIVRRGTSETIHGMDGELFRGITHQWNYDNENAGPFTEDETLTWGTGSTSGSGILLALNDLGATGTMWIQLLTGIPPVEDMEITGSGSSATADVDGSVTARSLSPVFLGQSTGTAIIGAFGIGIEAADLSVSDKLFDLTNTLQQPPNNVTFTVYGLVSGEDRVLVTNDDGTVGIETDQMTLAVTLNGPTETTIDVGTGNIPADTPQTGTLRVVLDDGRHRLVSYTAHDGDDEFTIASSDWQDPDDATAGADVYLSYIDKLAAAAQEAFTVVYDADRTLFVRVRDGGGTPIKTFETTGSLGTGGGSTTAIRTSDA